MERQQERELIEQVQQREAGAFDRLYEGYQERAYRTAVFLTGNGEDAQDVVQDTFVTVYQEIHKLKEPAAFQSWFYRILTHKAAHCTKKRNRELPVEEIGEEALGKDRKEQTDIADFLVKKEESQNLRAIISQMDEKHRTVLVLYYFNEFSVEQIAQITGSFAGTVKSRLYHARKQLEQKLSKAERRQPDEQAGNR